MLFCLITCHFFAAIIAVPTDRNDVVYPTVETLRSGIKVLKLRAFDRDIELRLENAGDIISDDFTFLGGEDGKTRQYIDVEVLKRKLYRGSNMGAALHIDEDGPLAINGIINHNLKIAPSNPGRTSENNIREHYIVELLNEEHSAADDQKFAPIAFNLSDYRVSRRQNCEKLLIEYAFMAESSLTSKFNSDLDLTNYIATTLVESENLMDTMQLNIKLTIIGVIAFKENNEPDFIKNNAFEVGGVKLLDDQLLQYFADYISNSNDNLIEKCDVILLMSQRQFGKLNDDGSAQIRFIGMSYIGNICNSMHKCGYVTDNEFRTRARTIAHETCHLLGSGHDGEPPSSDVPGQPGAISCPRELGYIMGDKFGDKAFIFSPCTKANVENWLGTKWTECIKEKCV